MSGALGCQVYYLVLSYALWLASLGRLASELTALAGFASTFHHFNFGALAQRQSKVSGGDCLECSSRERSIQLGWITALVQIEDSITIFGRLYERKS